MKFLESLNQKPVNVIVESKSRRKPADVVHIVEALEKACIKEYILECNKDEGLSIAIYGNKEDAKMSHKVAIANGLKDTLGNGVMSESVIKAARLMEAKTAEHYEKKMKAAMEDFTDEWKNDEDNGELIDFNWYQAGADSEFNLDFSVRTNDALDEDMLQNMIENSLDEYDGIVNEFEVFPAEDDEDDTCWNYDVCVNISFAE